MYQSQRCHFKDLNSISGLPCSPLAGTVAFFASSSWLFRGLGIWELRQTELVKFQRFVADVVSAVGIRDAQFWGKPSVKALALESTRCAYYGTCCLCKSFNGV
jgi:hypothetical protein